MTSTAEALQQRLQELESHLEQENPILLQAVQSFRKLDRLAYGMELLDRRESFANQIPWWPLVSILGTFSAGKSTFINDYLGLKLQRTGNQAVDDRFTVVVYSPEDTSRSLPGVSLDSDPRFPFYRMSRDIEQVAEGEGRRIDAYLQLKTAHSDRLRGKILIDSPGFDADAQRTATLRITDQMINLSDLVLVFFDARHPEPGAMRDTLRHLVGDTIQRADSGKFMYILNQLDATAGEDNPEDVVAAWLRALGEVGLTAGRFYTIYSRNTHNVIEHAGRRERFEKKRDEDLQEIYERMEQVEVERAYRIVAALRKTANDYREQSVSILGKAMRRVRNRTLALDLLVFGAIAAGFGYWSYTQGHFQGLHYQSGWFDAVRNHPRGQEWLFGTLAVVVLAVHLGLRRLMALTVTPWLRKQVKKYNPPGDLPTAFHANIRPWRSVLMGRAHGWGGSASGTVDEVLQNCEHYIQRLNERFTNPRASEGAWQPPESNRS